MHLSLVVNRRCGFRGARISNVLSNAPFEAAQPIAASRASTIYTVKMAERNQVRRIL
jgi:hypothetical protein